MDLLATVRKEGSRGGMGDFKWSDVQNSSRRENYLGHSLMAPVGRWQKGRDLNWYAKSGDKTDDTEDAEATAVRERKEEIRRVKEAEEDALARALGLPVPDRDNPNMQALGDGKAVEKILKDAGTYSGNNETGRGVGFDSKRKVTSQDSQYLREQIPGNADVQDRELQYALKEYKRRHGSSHNRGREHGSHSRSPDRRQRGRDLNSRKNRHRKEFSKDRHHSHRTHSRSRSAERRHRRDRRRERSRSPYRKDEDRRRYKRD